MSNITSSTPFAVRDATGPVAVNPDGANVDRPSACSTASTPMWRTRRRRCRAGWRASSSSFLRSGSQSGTLGFEYEEWVIRPGARLYVHGEVSDASGRVAFAKPSEGRYVISTRSEEEIVGAAERNAKIARFVTGVLFVAGVVLVVVGLLS